MNSKEKDDVVFARLFPGESIHTGLEEVCKERRVVSAVVLSGAGQLRECRLGFFRKKSDYRPELFEGPHELLSLSGNIIRQEGEYKFHLHAVLGNEGKEAIGGHLIEAVGEITAEIVLLKSGVELHRKLEDATGLEGLYFD